MRYLARLRTPRTARPAIRARTSSTRSPARTPGKSPTRKRTDALTDDLVDQGAPDGFDLGEFWHTRTTVAPRRPRLKEARAYHVAVANPFGVPEAMTDPPVTDCIFCRIARGELGTEFVAESEHNVAFRDLHPQAPVHVLIVPRHHFAALRDVGSDDWHVTADALLAGHARRRRARAL